MTLTLRTPAFEDGQPIPARYTADGENVSPPLEWSEAPAGTRSFALIMDDPDAPRGVFKHWAAYDIEAGRSRLAEGAAARRPEPLHQATNDYGHAGYDGPNPPRGHGTHHYRFQLMALDVSHLELPPRPSVDQVRSAARAHMLASCQIVGTYRH
jgi:Raf kinase inhibitor-like YbhB/YbcL family protein